MCSHQFNLWSIITPRYLILLILFNAQFDCNMSLKVFRKNLGYCFQPIGPEVVIQLSIVYNVMLLSISALSADQITARRYMNHSASTPNSLKCVTSHQRSSKVINHSRISEGHKVHRSLSWREDPVNVKELSPDSVNPGYITPDVLIVCVYRIC